MAQAKIKNLPKLVKRPELKLVSTDPKDLSSTLVHMRRHEKILNLASGHPGVLLGDLPLVLELISEQVCDVLKIERVGTWLVDDSSKHYICHDLFFRSKRLHIKEDIRPIEGDIDNYLSANLITSNMEFEILFNEKPIGLLCFENIGKLRLWTAEEIILGNQLATIIAETFKFSLKNKKINKKNENLQLNRQTKVLLTMNENLTILGELGQEITSSLNTEKISRIIYNHLKNNMELTCFMVYEISSDNQFLSMSFGYELDVPFPNHEIPVNHPEKFAARCARDKQEILVEQVEGELGTVGPILDTLDTVSLLFVPLLSGDRLIGVMTVQSMKEFAYSELDRLVFRTLGIYGAIAIDNANTYSKLKLAESKLVELNCELENKVKIRSQQLLEIEKIAQIGIHTAEIVHNINNPMTVIMGQLSILKKKYPDEDRISKSLVAVDKIKGMIQNILQTTKNNSDNQARQVDLNEILKQELSLLEVNEYFKYHVKLSEQLNSIPKVLCIPSHFTQIFGNLFKNAIESMHGMTSGVIKVSSRYENEHVVVEIADSGCGIPEDSCEKIFDPFFSTKSMIAINDEPIGTGLGLSSVKKMLESYGGEIKLIPNTEQGTIAILRLPVLQNN